MTWISAISTVTTTGAVLRSIAAWRYSSRTAKSPNPSEQKGGLVGAVGIELLGTFNTRKLLILRIGKREKNNKTLERGTRGLRRKKLFLASRRGHRTAQGIRNPKSARRSKTNPHHLSRNRSADFSRVLIVLPVLRQFGSVDGSLMEVTGPCARL
jgi:hypothetical protein